MSRSDADFFFDEEPPTKCSSSYWDERYEWRIHHTLDRMIHGVFPSAYPLYSWCKRQWSQWWTVGRLLKLIGVLALCVLYGLWKVGQR